MAFAHRADILPDVDPEELSPREEVEQQARRILGARASEYSDLRMESQQALPRGGRLSFVPEVTGVEFNPTSASFRWLEAVHRVEFRIRATSEFAGKTARGRLSVYHGSIIVAEVALNIRVLMKESGRATPARPEINHAVRYRQIFASYSHKDLAIVEQVEQFVRSAGDRYLKDWTQLRSGEVWNERLRDLIKEADVFQLFWSRNSMYSQFVRQEWEYALSLDRPNFVRPTYWEEPMPSDPTLGLPPAQLHRLHFHRIPVDLIAARTSPAERADERGAEIELGSWDSACEYLERAAALIDQEFSAGLTEEDHAAGLRREALVYDALVVGYVIRSRRAEQSGDRPRGASLARRAAFWAEKGQARNLVRLLTERDSSDAAPSKARLDSCDQKEQIRVPEVTSQDEIPKIADRARAALLTLRPTPWGTCAIVAVPGGVVHAKLMRGLTSSALQETLVQFQNGEPVGGWVVAYPDHRRERNRGSMVKFVRQMEAVLQTLGRELWRPLSTWLSGIYTAAWTSDGSQPLVISAVHALSILPLHAATWIEAGQRRYACDDYQIGYAPSAAVLDRCLQRRVPISPESRLLALRNPSPRTESHLPSRDEPLPWAEWEVDEVCGLFSARPVVLGSAAEEAPENSDRVAEELDRCDVALFATHAEYDLTNPREASGVYLASSSDELSQPRLSLRDIFQLKLSRLALVVLSACESALTDFRDRIGEHIGLPSAFLAAGAATAVGSLWSVEDFPTALLSRQFFRELLDRERNPSGSPGLALHRAQHWLRSLERTNVLAIIDTLAVDSAVPEAQGSESARRTSGSPTELSAGAVPAPCAPRSRLQLEKLRAERSRLSFGDDLPFSHPRFWSAFACYGAF